jgi:ABC-type protease/lipase transport system fused ATPase/permease subunit
VSTPRTDAVLAVIRQVGCLVLGAWLIVYAAITQGHDIPFLIAGLILIGVMPVDALLDKLHRHRD